MTVIISLLAAVTLILIAIIGAGTLGLQYLFGIVIPYATLAAFLFGIVYRVVKWARSPVPFHIPTTCGQQKSHPWIKYSKLESPFTALEVTGRMALEILFFRSLFRNTKVDLKKGPKLVYGSEKYLWLAGLAFHWSFLIILVRHLRFFVEPVPFFVAALQTLDGFFQIWLPIIYITDVVILVALLFLLFRRLYDPKLRYFSLAADYFPLFLLLSIAVTGYLMRYTGAKADLIAVKELAMGLLSFRPTIPVGLDTIFFIHLFLVSVLIAYFPFSKLMHMAGVFMSPTRNLANNSRAKRHVNPWDYDVKVHTYEEYEDEFREVMKAAKMPLEKE
ncbi:MAG: sulfate reduction electron transfer complex DsrMKJOP subunit DsrM [Candidatus Zixiibacteriota bacterium]|nr:MAG: sulfate reduction electron transfer complex DsrMKJOP subunit DsrM [candidate division Zixibacteria bacterium]